MEQTSLNDEEIHKSILEILSGERIFYSEEVKELLLFTNPTSSTKLYLEYIEEVNILKYLQEGYLSEKDIDDELKSQFFSTEDQDLLEELETKIKSYKLLLRKRLKNSPQAEQDKERIHEAEIQRDLLLSKKTQINNYTAEYKAKEDKYLELFTKCVTTLDHKRLWNSTEEFTTTIGSIGKFYSLLNNYLEFYFGYSTKKIRKIARSNLWINYYITSMKTGSPLFSNKPEDYSWNQLHLMSWSTFYMDIREMLFKDRPSDEVLDDDERLDKYLEEYYRKFKAEVALERNSGANSTSDKDQHLVVTAESENFVKFHKASVYSDPGAISNQVGDKASTYDEGVELKKLKMKRSGIK